MAKKAKTVTEFTATSLMSAFEETLKWTTRVNNGGTFWFRGANSSEFDLIPGAYRHSDYDEFRPLLDFVQEGRAFAEMGELNDWKTYYLAQHHGIPTRLLDWTESFSAALFFALDKWDGTTTPCVWAIRPECVNQLSIGWSGIVTPEQNKELELWLPRTVRKGPENKTSEDGQWIYNSALPLAIYPRKSNNRIVAQQGTFTVHGTSTAALNHWMLSKASKHSEMICRIVLKGLEKDEVLRQLTTLGVKRHTMYPDLHNYVSYLRECYHW